MVSTSAEIAIGMGLGEVVDREPKALFTRKGMNRPSVKLQRQGKWQI